MTSTLTLPEPYASAIVNSIAGWYTSEDPPPEELVGQRLIVVAGKAFPVTKPTNPNVVTMSINATGGGQMVPILQMPGNGHLNLHPGCIVGAVTLAEVVPVVAEENMMATAPYVRPMLNVLMHRFVDVADVEPDLPDCADIFDQLPWADWSPGRWAWRFENPVVTRITCPVCKGAGPLWGIHPDDGSWVPCPACDGDPECSPIPYSASEGLAEFDPGRLR